jgi:hypothetical protein
MNLTMNAYLNDIIFLHLLQLYGMSLSGAPLVVLDHWRQDWR